MAKYILGTDGQIKVFNEDNISSDIDPGEVSKQYLKRGGSTYSKESAEDFGKIIDVDLPVSQDILKELPFIGEFGYNRFGRHTLRDVEKPIKNNNDIFPVSSFDSEHNSSFGADEGFRKYRNFNDYLNKGEIFATELEIAGTGIDLNSGGLRDLSKFTIGFELMIEAIVYITAIEAILQVERAFDSNTVESEYNFQMEFGNYGPISYTTITRYFNDILNYPINKHSRSGVLSGPADRIGAFFIGLSLYLNSDPQVLIEKIGVKNIPVVSPLSEVNLYVDSNSTLELIKNISLYLLDSLLSLSNIETNRLITLVRRFNQKSDWHSNRLYAAKSENTKETSVEKRLIELNYYYVKFIIERMNIGLQVKKYYRHKKSNNKKFNRSGRIEECRSENGLYSLEYNNKSLKIKQHTLNDLSNKNKKRQSMSNAVLPQAFILPDSFIRSMYINNENSLSNAFLEEHVATYFLRTEKPQERLSNDVVKKLEAHYEKEMMPFYFQDLRTNEIIGFHAFIESITDNYNPNYNSTKGFGRIDDVKHYMDTTRNVNISFTLAAMSKEDHDLMWYQINKIVSMVYPQWSRGFEASSSDDPKNSGFEYPFTQVPTASPLIRIRLGDIIKTNYTKHAIEKIHGSGNKKVTSSGVINKVTKYYLLPGEYKDEDGEVFVINELKEAKILSEKDNNKYIQINMSEKNNLTTIDKWEAYLASGNFLYVDAKSIVEYVTVNSKIDNTDNTDNRRKSFKEYTSAYTTSDPKVLNNPITAAYETTLGKGLAGFITMLDVNYQDQLWETEVEGSKAPKLVKININFAPIHDIPPGLDADGAMRAPVYNTGKIINSLYGDVYEKKK